MSKTILRASIALAGVFTFTGSQANAQGCGILCQVPTLYPHVELFAGLPVGKSPKVEHTPAQVPIGMQVSPGVGGAKPTYDLIVCQADTLNCIVFPQVTPPWTAPSGATLTVDAPAAAQNAKVHFVACTVQRDANQVASCGHLLSEDDADFTTSMQIKIRLNSFTVLHTRAPSRDTVFAEMAGITQNLPTPNCLAKLAPFVVPNFCVGPRPAGDVGDGTHALNDVTIGPFELVPGRQRHLTFAYAILNNGARPILPPTNLNLLPVVMQRLANSLKAPVVDSDLTPELNLLQWSGCDGPTNAAVIRLFNHRGPGQPQLTIDEQTRATGNRVITTRTFIVPSPVGCGASGKYRVTWSIERPSWKP